MKRRWIIRGFFIALLMLTLAGWSWSYIYQERVGYSQLTRTWEVDINGGFLGMWTGEFFVKRGGWWADQRPYKKGGNIAARGPAEIRLLGVNISHFDSQAMSKWCLVQVPMSYLALCLGIGLCLIWRKARPKPVGRAFPVEAKQTVDEKTP